MQRVAQSPFVTSFLSDSQLVGVTALHLVHRAMKIGVFVHIACQPFLSLSQSHEQAALGTKANSHHAAGLCSRRGTEMVSRATDSRKCFAAMEAGPPVSRHLVGIVGIHTNFRLFTLHGQLLFTHSSG